MAEPTRILILGAAGRDFHNFNRVYRDDPAVEVVAFTATQIPGIAGRRYPAELAGPRYPRGIPIEDEARLDAHLRPPIGLRIWSNSSTAKENTTNMAASPCAWAYSRAST